MIAIIGMIIVIIVLVGGIVTAVISALSPEGSSGKTLGIIVLTFAIVGAIGGAFLNFVSLPVDEARPIVSEDRTGICFSDPPLGHSIYYCVWDDDSKEGDYKKYKQGEVVPITRNLSRVRSKLKFFIAESDVCETEVYVSKEGVSIIPIIQEIKSISAIYNEREASGTTPGNTYVGYILSERDFTVTGIDDEGEEVNIKSGFSFTPKVLKEGQNNIKIEYGISDQPKAECTLPIFGYPPKLLYIKANLKEAYENEIRIGDVLTQDYFEVTGGYENGEKRTIEDFIIEPAQMPEEEGECAVEISKGDLKQQILVNVYDPVNIVKEETGDYAGTGNNSIEKANDINVNEHIVGRLVNEEDIDYYKFKLEQKGNVRILFEHQKMDEGKYYWEISLLSKDENESHYSFKSMDRNAKTESTTIRLPKGTYFLKVTPYDYSDEEYKIQVIYEEEDKYYESEPNNEIKYATEIEVNPEKPFTGNLETADDIDYYSILIPEKGKIRIDFTHQKVDNDDRLWDIAMMGESEAPITTFGSRGTVGKLSSYYVRVSPGEYIIRVAHDNWVEGYTENDYSMAVQYWQEGTESETEPNNEFRDASDIFQDVPIIGNIQSNEDYDYYKFVLDGKSDVSLRFKHEKVDHDYPLWVVTLHSENEGEPLKNKEESDVFYVKGNDPETSTCTWEDLPAGEYVVRVHGSNYDDDAFNLDYELLVTH